MIAQIIKKIINNIEKRGIWGFVAKAVYFVLIEKILATVLKWISLIVPPNSSLVVFGSQGGAAYTGNSRVVYEHIHNKNNLELNAIWITKSERVYYRLIKQGKPVAMANSPRGLWLVSRAKVGAVTGRVFDITIKSGPVPDKIVQLKHGNPVKFGEKNYFESERKKAKLRKRSESDYLISTSEFMTEMELRRLPGGRGKFVVTGYPRNDKLVSPSKEIYKKWESYIQNNVQCDFDHVVLYAPTYRHPDRWNKSVELFPFPEFNITDLKDYLPDQNILLLIRLHPGHELKMNRGEHKEHYQQLRKDLNKLEEMNNVEYISSKQYPDANHFLPYIDALITDYSSIYHDFLLLDRPILFIPYDIRKFENKIGFIYDYEENIPGPIVNCYTDFEKQLTRSLSNEHHYAIERQKLRNKIHQYQDDRSTERVSSLIELVLMS